MTIYISGPVSGVKNYQKAFHKAEDILEGNGHVAISPIAVKALQSSVYSWSDAMKICITLMEKCDAVMFLDGWEFSVGARIEHAWAQRIGLPVYEGIDSLVQTAI